MDPAISSDTRKTTSRYGVAVIGAEYRQAWPIDRDPPPAARTTTSSRALSRDGRRLPGVRRNLGSRPRARRPGRRLARPPSIRFEDYPREVAKREIRVSEAARLANALHLHLD